MAAVGGGSSKPTITSPELKTPQAQEQISKLGGAESPLVQEIDKKTPDEVVADMAQQTVDSILEQDSGNTAAVQSLDKGNVKNAQLYVGDFRTDASNDRDETPTDTLSSVEKTKTALLAARANLADTSSVEDKVVRMVYETGNYVQRRYRLYNQQYSTVTAYMGSDAYTADNNKVGGDGGSKFKFDKDNGLVGDQTGTLAAVQAKTGSALYTGKAFDANNTDGTFTYTINFGSNATGSGAITGLGGSANRINLEQTNLTGLTLQGNATGNVNGVYTVNLYGPQAQEVAGFIKANASEDAKSLVGFGGKAQ